MKWILFIYILNTDGPRIQTQEFGSPAPCMHAADKINKMPQSRLAQAWCEPYEATNE